MMNLIYVCNHHNTLNVLNEKVFCPYTSNINNNHVLQPGQ